MANLRLKIFRLLEERDHRHPEPGLPTAGEIAQALGEPLRRVVVVLRSSAAIGQVELAESYGMEDKDLPVMLKPPAYIYLESRLDE